MTSVAALMRFPTKQDGARPAASGVANAPCNSVSKGVRNDPSRAQDDSSYVFSSTFPPGFARVVPPPPTTTQLQ